MKQNDGAAQQMRNLMGDSINKLKEQVMEVQQQSRQIMMRSMEEFYKTQFANAEQAIEKTAQDERDELNELRNETTPNDKVHIAQPQNAAQNAAQHAMQVTQACIAKALQVTDQSIQNAEKIMGKGI